jgi:hypothetical protein
MNFGKGGQNIVQAGSGGSNVFKGFGGNILETYLGTKLRRGERDYHREKDEESRIRINDASHLSRVKANALEGLLQPQIASNYYDQAFKTYGENHPEVLAGNKQANDPIRPEFAKAVFERGVTSGKHGVFPAQVPASVFQGQNWEASREAKQNSKTSKDDTSATVARFGKDGKITREPVSYGDIGVEESFSERPPASMTKVDESTRPSNQTFTPQQKADLEKERPRTSNLNMGINESRQPSANDVSEAVGLGKVTLEEASDLSPTHNRIYKPIINDAPDSDIDINETHKRAGLNNNTEGTKY